MSTVNGTRVPAARQLDPVTDIAVFAELGLQPHDDLIVNITYGPEWLKAGPLSEIALQPCTWFAEWTVAVDTEDGPQADPMETGGSLDDLAEVVDGILDSSGRAEGEPVTVEVCGWALWQTGIKAVAA